MERDDLVSILAQSPSPAYVIHLGLLEENLRVLKSVEERSGATVLMALKAFAGFHTFPLIRRYLSGICASGPIEAQLGHEEFGGQIHTFAPAFTGQDMDKLLRWTDHLVFNSFSQWQRWKARVQAAERPIACGLRVNPEHSTGQVPLYDPCAPGSRLGIKRDEFAGQDLDGISGLHFHTLCEQNSDDLESTVEAFEEKFSEFFPQLEWVNFGGGHHITRPDYDIDRLVRIITDFRQRHNLAVFLEPGEAVALNTGVLIATVLDILPREPPMAILDTSATAHMPDVLEMPYRPQIVGAGEPGEKAHTYQLGGMTCLAGDQIGEYSFDAKLSPGDRLAFLDMAHYTMVKTTMFNGVQHPSIALYHPDTDQVEVVRRFGYEDFRNRMG